MNFHKSIPIALVALGIVFLAIVLLSRTQDRDFEIRGEASGIVESFDVIAVDENSGLPVSRELAELVGAQGLKLEHDLVGSVHCRILTSSWIQHWVFDNQDDCPLEVVNQMPNYDLLIAFYDSICKNPPRLVVDQINGQYRFVVDVDSGRGGCDNIAVPNAVGIRLESQLLGDADG